MPWLLECARKIVEAEMYFASAENVEAEMYFAQCLGCWNVHGKLWRLKCISPMPGRTNRWREQRRLKLLLTFLLLARATAAEIVTNIPSAGGECHENFPVLRWKI